MEQQGLRKLIVVCLVGVSILALGIFDKVDGLIAVNNLMILAMGYAGINAALKSKNGGPP